MAKNTQNIADTTTAFTTTFYLFLPDDTLRRGYNLCVKTDLAELGGWETNLFILEKINTHLYVGSLEVPAVKKSPIIFNYKYALVSDDDLEWEFGDNRALKDPQLQIFDVWRTQTQAYQSSAGRYLSGWGNNRVVKGVYKCYTDYLFFKLSEAIEAGEYDTGYLIHAVHIPFTF